MSKRNSAVGRPRRPGGGRHNQKQLACHLGCAASAKEIALHRAGHAVVATALGLPFSKARCANVVTIADAERLEMPRCSDEENPSPCAAIAVVLGGLAAVDLQCRKRPVATDWLPVVYGTGRDAHWDLFYAVGFAITQYRSTRGARRAVVQAGVRVMTWLRRPEVWHCVKKAALLLRRRDVSASEVLDVAIKCGLRIRDRRLLPSGRAFVRSGWLTSNCCVDLWLL